MESEAAAGAAGWAAGTFIALGALVVSVGTVIAGVMNMRSTAKVTHIGLLMDRIAQVERDLEKCQQRCEKCEAESADLRKENYRLMQAALFGPRIKDLGRQPGDDRGGPG